MSTVAEKTCKECLEVYKPSSNVQQFCPECRAKRDKAAKKAYNANRYIKKAKAPKATPKPALAVADDTMRVIGELLALGFEIICRKGPTTVSFSRS